MKGTHLTTDKQERKNTPIATGFIDYFPKAIAEVARLSQIGNDQHNPNQRLHWDRSKSGDESDAMIRHFIERGSIDEDGVRHSTKVAWRALANLEKELEKAESDKAASNRNSVEGFFSRRIENERGEPMQFREGAD